MARGSRRSGGTVASIVSSIRADEISPLIDQS
jgi:hypothetical protein